MNGRVSDEMLMALADGELDAESARSVEAAAAADPRLAERLEGFRRSRAAVREAFGDVLSAPVPDRLVATVRGGSPAPVAARPARRTAPRWRAALPLAACLALAVGLAGLWSSTRFDEGGFATGTSGIAARLATQPSGVAVSLGGDGSTLAILGSYPVGDGLCRVFDVAADGQSRRGVGCDRGSGYAVELLALAGAVDGFTPAADGATASVDAFLDAAGAGPALSAEEEAARLSPGRDR